MVVETVQAGIITIIIIHDQLVYVVEYWMPFKLLELDNAQYYYTDHVKRVTKKVSIFTPKLFFSTILSVKETSTLQVRVLRDSKFKVLLSCLHSIKKNLAIYYVQQYRFHKKRSIHTPQCSVIDWKCKYFTHFILFFLICLFSHKQYYFWSRKTVHKCW